MTDPKLCKCRQPVVDAVINMTNGEIKEVCQPCGQTYISMAGYKGPWWYTSKKA